MFSKQHSGGGSFMIREFFLWTEWSLANFRHACTRAGLSREALCMWQDFNLCWCVVSLMVTFETMLRALFRWLTRPSRVVLGRSLAFLIIDATQESKSCMLPLSRGDWQTFWVIVFFPGSLPVVLQPIPAYKFIPGFLNQLSGLTHGGEIEVLTECLDSCLLYRWLV